MATNNRHFVWFWQWDEQDQVLRYDDTRKEMKILKQNGVRDFTQTVFIPRSTQAVSGTETGDIVVWDISFVMDSDANPEQRRPIKHLKLFRKATSLLQTIDNYLVVGSQDGFVRFYDQRFIVEAWFESIHAGNIMSVSFANLEPRNCWEELEQQTENNSKFACPDFIVATDQAKIISMRSTYFERVPQPGEEETFRQGEPLLQGFKYPVGAISVHPTKPWIAAAGGVPQKRCYIYVWNYQTRRRIKFNEPETGNVLKQVKAEPLCIAYSPDGQYLCAGFSDGQFLLLDANNVYQERQSVIKYTENPKPIFNIIFSKDGKAMATMDKEKCVTLFKWDHRRNNPDLPMEWIYCGSHRSHNKKINAIAFGESINEHDVTVLRLFSVGDDRQMVEYDTFSTDMTQLMLVSQTKVEQEYKPTACIWYPVNTGEDLLLTMNSGYKVKLWNVNNKGCRLTCLGPTYGNPATKLKLLVKQKSQPRTAIDEPNYFLAYATDRQIVGLMKMPADGNPNKMMGLIAHPGVITDLQVSGDHKFIFTSGGDDLSVNMWFIDPEAIEKQIAIGGQGDEPFENMIDGGKYGKNYKDMKDFFYYSQIRSKKENTTQTRKLEGYVPLDEMGNLMRAMGYYPSEQEIENMKNEVKYSRFTETGQAVNQLGMDTLLKVFVNHRPIYGVEREEILEAFNVLAGENGVLPRRTLLKILRKEGERIRKKELRSCLESLLAPTDEDIEEMLPDEITANDFIEKILGFEQAGEEDIEGDYEIVEVDDEA